MRAFRRRTRLIIIGMVGFGILTSMACLLSSKESGNSIESTLSVLESNTTPLAMQVTRQVQSDATQPAAIAELSTQMPSIFEVVTEVPTLTPLDDVATPYPVCTPPACEPDEMYYCAEDCPGGCGTTCATATPGISSGSGQVWGKVCAPGETIPEMTVYFQETSSGQTLEFPIAESQDAYQMAIPVGVYVAFAWLQNKEAGGGYTQFVRCTKTTLSCTDHSLVRFLVRENHVTVGVDICDWDADPALFPVIPDP